MLTAGAKEKERKGKEQWGKKIGRWKEGNNNQKTSRRKVKLTYKMLFKGPAQLSKKVSSFVLGFLATKARRET